MHCSSFLLESTKMGIKTFFYILLLISFSYSVLPEADAKPSGLTLKLLHRDSIESNNLTRIEKFQQIIHRSNLRANQLMISTASEHLQYSYHHPQLSYEVANYDYLVELRVGTPPSSDRQFLILDTGRELTWLQCDGCIDCFQQTQTKYNPHRSETYELLPCDHQLCKAYECNHGHCKFKEWDSPDVHVEGFMSKDVFGFPSDSGDDYTSLDGVVFGCAYGTVGFPFQDNKNNNITGVFGLGPGPRSFTSQFAPQRRFAYCLPDWQFGPPRYPGQLLFGDDALLPVSGHVRITPIVETDGRSYFLKLLDMQISSRKKLGFKRGKFDRKHDVKGSHGGFTIDSGTALSYLAGDVYDVVRQEFVDHMKTLNLTEIVALSGLDLCWDFPPELQIVLPSMSFFFQDNEYPDKEAELVIDALSIFFIEQKAENPHICLGILRSNGEDPDLSILGGKQQTGTRFAFDGQANTLSWRAADCSSPHK